MAGIALGGRGGGGKVYEQPLLPTMPYSFTQRPPPPPPKTFFLLQKVGLLHRLPPLPHTHKHAGKMSKKPASRLCAHPIQRTRARAQSTRNKPIATSRRLGR